MKKQAALFILFLAVATGFYSCKKDSSSSPTPSGGFTWSYQGTNYTADSAYMIQGTGGAGINAYLGTSGSSNYRFWEINLNGAVAPGSYVQGNNDLIYWTNSGPNMCAPFTVNITSLSGGKVSGNFTGTLPAGTITGSFNSIPVR